jgi:hypothetical protein
VYVARHDVFEHFPPAIPNDGVIDFGYHILPQMLPHLSVYRIDEFLADIGTIAAYKRAEIEWPGLLPAPVPEEASAHGGSFA